MNVQRDHNTIGVGDFSTPFSIGDKFIQTQNQ